jgi:hypothetical protein
MKLAKALKPRSSKKNPRTEFELVTKPASESMPVKTSVPARLAIDSKPTQKTSRTATIQAKIDVGFGNMLYMRGEGSGLNWDQGIPLKCVDGSTWEWSGETDAKLKFKLLLNDAVWAQGEDLVVTPGQKLQVSPAF